MAAEGGVGFIKFFTCAYLGSLSGKLDVLNFIPNVTTTLRSLVVRKPALFKFLVEEFFSLF